MPRIREGDQYFSEEEYKKHKQQQSEGSVVLLFFISGGIISYVLLKPYGLEKIYLFLIIIVSALGSAFIAGIFSKYLVMIFRIIGYSLFVGVILSIIWFSI